MQRHGVPLVPGYHGADQDPARLLDEAERIGFPVLIKASAGGGGRGMRVVGSAGGIRRGARRRKARGGRRFRRRPRAAREIPASGRGTSKSRSSPTGTATPCISSSATARSSGAIRRCWRRRRRRGSTRSSAMRIGEAAVAAARAVGYVGAGTVEFIAESDGDFYFIEMNTRLQVEHPVTEAVTGLDLVEWQLRVAAGEPLPLRQQDLVAARACDRGAALCRRPGARVSAADRDIASVCGLPPPDIARVDTGVRQGDTVTPFYDPMIAKIIAWGEDRAAARRPAAPRPRRDRGARGRDQPRRFWRGSPRIRNSPPERSIPALSNAIAPPCCRRGGPRPTRSSRRRRSSGFWRAKTPRSRRLPLRRPVFALGPGRWLAAQRRGHQELVFRDGGRSTLVVARRHRAGSWLLAVRRPHDSRGGERRADAGCRSCSTVCGSTSPCWITGPKRRCSSMAKAGG